MICPKCGNDVDLFADNCLKCGRSFKSLSLAERRKLTKGPEVKTTPIRMTYDNGIPVGEGMSISGTKQKRGAHRPFLYKF